MDREEIIRRIAELEEELASIKALVAPAIPLSRLGRPLHAVASFILSYWVLLSFVAAVAAALFVKHAFRVDYFGQLHGVVGFVLSYWVLLSFAAAVVTALYVKYEFQIDYFETYRNQSTLKKISEIHRQIGDLLLGRTEWEAAANAYKEAIAINPNNKEAAIGLVQARVFLPEAAQKFAVPEIIDAKLLYLEAQFPNDYMVSFLKGQRSLQIGDNAKAQESLEQSIRINPHFPGGYLALGTMALSRLDRKAAIENFTKALDSDQRNPTALNNLGYMYFLSAKYEESAKYFYRSQSISPQMLTGINLGEAYRCEGDYLSATNVHQETLKNAERLKGEYERYLGGEWDANFLPLAPDDTETMKNYVPFRTREQKLGLAHFELALDYASSGLKPAADSEFDEALRLEDAPPFRAFYANRMTFFQGFPNLTDQAKGWLAEHRAKLELDEKR